MCIFNHACICCLYKLAPTVRPTQNMRVHLGKKAIKKTNQSTNNQWIEPSRAPSICLLVHRSRASPDTMIHAQLARSYGGQPLLGLLVWHDAPGPPSCCRYSRRRSWRVCSPASPALSPAISGRAELDAIRRAMIAAATTATTTMSFDLIVATDSH